MAGKRSGGKKRMTPRRPHLRSMPTTSEGGGPEDPASEQPLIQTLRRALRGDHPIDFLMAVGGLLAATDPRARDPFARDDDGHAGFGDLVDSFVGTDLRETTAALTVIRALVADELLATRIAKVLSGRRQPLPAWLDELDNVRISDVQQMTHILGDGDNYYLEATAPGGFVLTALIYVDHNLGTVVKDAFLIPEGTAVLGPFLEEHREDPDHVLQPFDPATARAIITEAIDHGAMIYPPLESDQWPLCRPIVEWLVRRLPTGGEVPARPEWSEADLEALHQDFFGSSYGATLDAGDERDLLGQLTFFGNGWGPGDPLRWSPVNVEMVLADWAPRKIDGPRRKLAKLPDLMRAFVRYCHDRQGLRGLHTTDVLAAIDHWEPEYRDLIGDESRPRGAEGLARRLLDSSGGSDDEPELEIADIMLEGLDRKVGGRGRVLELSDQPLPDEAMDWAGIPEDVHERVGVALDWCDRCAEEFFDREYRTAFRRLLGRAAAADPAIFRRRSSDVRAAAAVCWLVSTANGEVGAHWSATLEVRELLAFFRVAGSVSQRAEPFLKAIGVDPWLRRGDELGSPDYLVSARRRDLMESRDRWLGQLPD